jgi:error-prone DNA polymerase
MQIKGLNSNTMQRIVDRRDVLYSSFEDCLERTALTPSEAHLLVKSGCFDRLEPERTRPELLWQIALSSGRKTNTSDQNSLFSVETEKPPRPPEYDEKTILQQEVETLGFLISRHPLELYAPPLNSPPAEQGGKGADDHFTINNKRYIKACALEKYVGKKIDLIGWLVTGKVVPTKNCEAMEFVTFEDTTGLIETVFFPQAFKQFNHMLSYTRPFRLFGRVEEDFGAVTVTIERVGYL